MSETDTKQLDMFLDEIFETLQIIQDSYKKLNVAFGDLLLGSPQIGKSWVGHRQELMNQKSEEEKRRCQDTREIEGNQEEQIQEPQYQKQRQGGLQR